MIRRSPRRMSVGVVTRGQAKSMTSAQSIERLIKWARRDEWGDELALQFDRHVGAACESAKIPIDELAGIIGEHWASALWGCAFEDLVSTTREGLNIAEDYLKRRGWKEKEPPQQLPNEPPTPDIPGAPTPVRPPAGPNHPLGPEPIERDARGAQSKTRAARRL